MKTLDAAVLYSTPMATSTRSVHLYQIAYSEETWNLVAPGFIALDNRANARPDWAEYWPIRNFLLSEELDDNALYGFVSPRFAEKLHCSSDDILAFAASLGEQADIASFSPYFDLQAAFLNPFEQGEFSHPGLLDTAARALREVMPRVDLRTLLCRTGDSIYCNYLAAKPAFWRKWLGVCERIFAMAESASHPLHAALNRPYAHRGANQTKVFVIERIAALLVTVDKLAVARFAQSSLSGIFPNTDPEVFEQLSALKLQACDGNSGALAKFEAMRDALLESADATRERARLIADSIAHGTLHAPSAGYEHWGSAPLRQLYAQGQIGLWRLLSGSLRRR